MRLGDAKRERLRLFSIGSRPAIVDGVVEEVEPAIEVIGGECRDGVDSLMLGERIALVSRLAQQDPLPELHQFGDVGRPVDLGDIVEDRSEEIVLGDIGVEASHHFFDLFDGMEIAASASVGDGVVDSHEFTLVRDGINAQSSEEILVADAARGLLAFGGSSIGRWLIRKCLMTRTPSCIEFGGSRWATPERI